MTKDKPIAIHLARGNVEVYEITDICLKTRKMLDVVEVKFTLHSDTKGNCPVHKYFRTAPEALKFVNQLNEDKVLYKG